MARGKSEKAPEIAPITAENARTFGDFMMHKKRPATEISVFTVPPGTPFETPEGLKAEDEETRIAFDSQGGVYPVRESVFAETYAPLTPDDIRGGPDVDLSIAADDLVDGPALEALSIRAAEPPANDRDSYLIEITNPDALSETMEQLVSLLRAAERLATEVIEMDGGERRTLIVGGAVVVDLAAEIARELIARRILPPGWLEAVSRGEKLEEGEPS